MADANASGPSPYKIKPGFRTEVFAILRETIGVKLRHEELKPLEQTRNKALLKIDRHHPDPYLFFLEHAARYAEGCREVLRCIKPVIHEELDDMLRALELELLSQGRSVTGAQPYVLHDTGHPDYVSDNEPFTPPSPGGHVPSRSHSPTTEQETHANSKEPPVSDPAPSMTEAGSPVIAPSNPLGRKRPAPPQNEAAGHGPQKKKAKGTYTSTKPKRIKRSISTAEPDECVFRYKNHKGFYALRCNRKACKRMAQAAGSSGDPIYFREYLFGESATWKKHFTFQGHSMKSMDEVFDKHAFRVTKATEERNIHGPDSGSDNQPTIVGIHREQTPAPRQQQPLSPISIAQDKGKQPEREQPSPIDDELAAGVAATCEYWERNHAFEDLFTSSSDKTVKNNTKSAGNGSEQQTGEPDICMAGTSASRLLSPAEVRAQGAVHSRNKPSNSSSSSHTNINTKTNTEKKGENENENESESESESESEEEFPPVEHLKNGARWKTRVDYRGKPPRVDEFK